MDARRAAARCVPWLLLVWVCACWGCPIHRSRRGESQYVYSQFFQRGALAERERGVFVELGALDGLHASNSYFFETCLGWRGMLIEGNPQSFAALVKNRPNATNLNMAICRSERTVNFTATAKPVSGVVDKMSRPFLKHYYHTRSPPQIEVYCGTLAHQFCIHGIDTIHFLSIDVEGGELDVVLSIDFSRVNIYVAVVESSQFNVQSPGRDQVQRIFKEHGFEVRLDAVPRSDVYVNTNWPLPPIPIASCARTASFNPRKQK